MNENEITYNALERLREQTGIAGEFTPNENEVDGELDLYINHKGQHLFVEAKRELRQHQLPAILELAKQYQPLIIVAENIFPALKKILRDNKIGYLDTAGNIYLHTEDNYIWIDGNKPVAEKKKVTNRAFTKTGLKTVFYLLLHQDAVNMPYRRLAEATDVALGNIKNVIEGLKEAGFILQINDNTLALQNKKALLERWVNGYKETLQPTLLLGTYRFWDDKKLLNWKALPLPLEIAATQWGGEPAAEILTDYLRPQTLTLYTEQKTVFVTKWTLIPDAKGPVHFYKKFWRDELLDKENYTPPLLVYADLLITDDPRCREIAQMIYDKHLKHAFE